MHDDNSYNAQHEEIKFRDVVIFYNFVFDIGRTINPIDEARRLLRTDLGIATPNYLTNEIEIASRFNELINVQKYLRQLGEWDNLLQQERLKDLTKEILRHPKQALNMWRSGRRVGKGSRNTVKDTDYDEKTINDEQRTTQDVAHETTQFINDVMIDAQSLMAIHLFSDRSLFSPIYLAEIPFARVELQPFFTLIKGEKFAIDASLLIHRSGIAIISFFVSVEKEKTADELIALQRSGELRITNLEIAKPVVAWQLSAFRL